MADSGTLRLVRINKIKYDASGETDVSRKSGQWVTESQATTGDSNFKVTKQVEDREGIDLVLDSSNRSNLIDFVDSRRDGDLELQYSDGSVETASGRITITGDASMDNKVTVTMHPRRRWTLTTV